MSVVLSGEEKRLQSLHSAPEKRIGETLVEQIPRYTYQRGNRDKTENAFFPGQPRKLRSSSISPLFGALYASRYSSSRE